jgi:xanthine/CO dehydrogenase XdhC/CoxF family maturation factor
MNRQAGDILHILADRKLAGVPFALATVVRTVAATAAKAGVKAIILPDGTISEGWIGGRLRGPQYSKRRATPLPMASPAEPPDTDP